jgi:3',5'-cyclic AMP phosphodiesterase CpdA
LADTGRLVRAVADDTLLVFLSDVHIGGSGGDDIFEAGAELAALLDELKGHSGPVELVLAGDFLDLLRMGDVGAGAANVAKVLDDPRYRDVFDALRRFAGRTGCRVVYVVGNHDVEVWWNTDVRRRLVDAGLVHEFALTYSARFGSVPDRVVHCEHGNRFDPTNAIDDYANPLDTPLGAHIVTELVRPIGSGVAVTRRLDLRDVSFVFPLGAIPQWIAGRLFYQGMGQVLRWLVAPIAVIFLAKEVVVGVQDAPSRGSDAFQSFLLNVAYDVVVLLLGVVVLFLVTRRTGRRVAAAMAGRFGGL